MKIPQKLSNWKLEKGLGKNLSPIFILNTNSLLLDQCSSFIQITIKIMLQTLGNVLMSLVTGSWEIYQEQSLSSLLFQS